MTVKEKILVNRKTSRVFFFPSVGKRFTNLKKISVSPVKAMRDEMRLKSIAWVHIMSSKGKFMINMKSNTRNCAVQPFAKEA